MLCNVKGSIIATKVKMVLQGLIGPNSAEDNI